MLDAALILTITERTLCEEFINFYQDHGVTISLVALGDGTASREKLDLFGLEETEKALIFALAPRSGIRPMLKGLERELRIGAPGRGIVLTLPISSAGGDAAMKVFTLHHEKEGNEMDKPEAFPFELIIAITNEGYTDVVIDAARKSRATGGTMVHARGAGSPEMRKFFGFSVSDEKEMVFIVCRRSCRNRIMKSIMAEAGQHSKAKSIVFSLPVASAEGLWILDHEDADDDSENRP